MVLTLRERTKILYNVLPAVFVARKILKAVFVASSMIYSLLRKRISQSEFELASLLYWKDWSKGNTLPIKTKHLSLKWAQ